MAAKRKGKSAKKKQERFKKDFPKGRGEFAKAKRILGLRRGQATNHSVIFKQLA